MAAGSSGLDSRVESSAARTPCGCARHNLNALLFREVTCPSKNGTNRPREEAAS